MVRIEFADGTTLFLQGSRGEERLTSSVNAQGARSFYEGRRGQEYLVREELPDGSKVFYSGGKGQEQIVRREDPEPRTTSSDRTRPRSPSMVQRMEVEEDEEENVPEQMPHYRPRLSRPNNWGDRTPEGSDEEEEQMPVYRPARRRDSDEPEQMPVYR